MPQVQPSFTAFQNFNALNALGLVAAWNASPDRAESVWNGMVQHGNVSWASRFEPMIQRLMAPAPTSAPRPPRL